MCRSDLLPYIYLLQSLPTSQLWGSLREETFTELLSTGHVIEKDFLRRWSISSKRLDSLRRELQSVEPMGIEYVLRGDADYPSCFSFIDRAPFVFAIKGDRSLLRAPKRITVVGGRKVHPQSRDWMDLHLSAFLEQHRQTVLVSGGARGIDQLAHGLALRQGAPSIAVLPSGLGHLYPAELSRWWRPFLDAGGLWLSEYSPLQEMRKNHFQARNRLLAALGNCTLVIQAARPSGTLITARWAMEMGRCIAVVPGHPQEFLFSGSLDLLHSGAQIVRDVWDLQTLSELLPPSYDAKELSR